MVLSAALLTVLLVPTQPNIVLIVGDDVGYGELTCFNAQSITPTPHIDELAHVGVRFTNAHVTTPVCGPSRAGLLTGKFPSRFGFEMNSGDAADDSYGIPLAQTILPQRLKQVGYKTASIGKWHVGWLPGMQPQQRGFDYAFGFAGAFSGYYATHKLRELHPIYRNGVIVDEREYLTFAFRREAVKFIEKQAGADKPFFLYLPFNAIHTPFEAPQEYLNKFPDVNDRKRKYLSAMLAAQDDAVGDVLQSLKDQAIDRDTLVIYISDNGGEYAPHVDNRPLKGWKFTMWEGGLRVPMIMSWAGKPWSNGRTYSGLTSSVDILPTIYSVAGVEPPRNIDGVDLLPKLRGSQSPARPPLFFRYGPEWAVLSDKWKLLHQVDNDTLQPTDWLFDLSTDIGETTNLMDSKPTIAANLRTTYKDWSHHLPAPLWYSWPGYKGER